MLKRGKLKSDSKKEKKKGRALTEVLCFNVIHRLSVGRMEDPQLNTDRVSLRNGGAGVRIGHIEIPLFREWLYKCNFLAFMFICRSVRYIPGRYVSSHNHTTMDNQRMRLKCVELSMEQSIAPVWAILAKCVRGCDLTCVCVCVPRLPLLPMLGSLASTIQLYSGGMETGLRSPGTTNQQSESLLWGREWG